MSPKSKVLCAIYGVIALAALVGTWSQNLAFFALPDNGGMPGFLRATAANPAATSIALDLGFMCLAAFPWMVVESRRLGIRFVWIYISLSLAVAVSVMFPLFLLAREIKLSAAGAAGEKRGS